MWSGSSGSSADEWIELYNRSAATIDLSGWTLTRLSNDEFQVMFIFDTASIASGQTFLIANYTADHEKSRLATEPQFVSTSISLPNSKLLLQLYDNNPTNGGQLIDSVDDWSRSPFCWLDYSQTGHGSHCLRPTRSPIDKLGNSNNAKWLGPQCD